MKSLTNYIQEKLVIKKRKIVDYKYFPKTTKELDRIVNKRIMQEGNEVDLNDIDTSNITDMSYLFSNSNFKGDISSWNVSNVTNMRGMFFGCKEFNCDISNWDVANVKDMHSMFKWCAAFNQDISNWDVSNVTNMGWMFYNCIKFDNDISNWNVLNVKDFTDIFYYCPIKEKYKPKFK